MTAAASTLPRPSAAVMRRAALWLVFLAPFFYLTYGFANWYAARQPNVGSIVFAWEHFVPFIAWTIVPYWSINAFYALSLFVNETPSAVNRLAGRYLTAQCVAVVCFIAFPLTATFVRPETSGVPGFMFAVLGGFDKPFNQAPSLHIALLVIIWDHWRHILPRAWRFVWHLWCFLIGASVLTTWQHHFIDIPTGALLGLFAVWLFPREGEPPLAGLRLAADPRRRRLALYYGAGAILCLAAAWQGAGAPAAAFAMLWPALALAIVSIAYAGAGAKIFQKRADGTVPMASRLLLWPYRLGARLNAFAWTRSLAPSVEIAAGVSLGRFPSAAEADSFRTVIDLAAELERPRGVTTEWQCFPMLDLVPPPAEPRKAAALAVEQARQRGPVLVCCALGFQRSACVVAEWLVDTGRAAALAEAYGQLAAAGRPVHAPDGDLPMQVTP